MTLTYLKGRRIIGVSSDAYVAPPNSKKNWRRENIDKGTQYDWDGTKWIYSGMTEEAKSFFAIQNNGDDSPLIRLTGDEFAVNAESSLYLLGDLTSAMGGGALTNNNAVMFQEETDLPLRGHTVANLVSASSQYLSRATESQFEVGTGSFIASIWFKTSTTGAAQTLWSYGDLGVLPVIRVQIDSNNKLYVQLHDGSVSSSVTDTIANRWNDGRWHCCVIMLDTSLATDTVFLLCDGQLIGSAANALGTLNASGKSFAIGALQNTAFGSFFNGQLANFHLIKAAADYNAIAVLNQGIRESVASGTIPAPTNDSAKRFNSKIVLPATANSYATCVSDFEDGEYETQVMFERQAAGGTLSLEIDGVQIVNLSTDGSASSNIISKTYGVKIGAGKHLIKVKNTEANTIPLQWINFIKRKGHENGGATEFLLLGDEIEERSSVTVSKGILTTAYYNSFIQVANTDGGYTEGSLFLKGGLWRVDAIYPKGTDRGKADLDFGNAEVLDQLDQYAGSGSENNIVTYFVRLPQGKSDIRFAVNGKNASSSNYYILADAVRGVRVSD